MRDCLTNYETCHAGIVLERLVPDLSNKNTRPERIAGVVESVREWYGENIYSAAFELHEARLRDLPRLVAEKLQTTDRVIVGLGAENPMETSITLNRLYGVPMIPGSALKGVARAFARLHRPEADADAFDRQMKFLFGTTEGGGRITFFDAWWVPGDPPLRKDVITVHHQPYYTSKGAEAPTDFDDPNPVSFVSARGAFLFAVQGPTPDWAQLAMGLLKGGLAHLGVGAKTSSGYGRFGPVTGSTAGDTGAKAPAASVPDPAQLEDKELEAAVKALTGQSIRDHLEEFATRWHTIQSGHTKRAVGLAIQAKSRASGVRGQWMSPINNFLQRK